MRALGRGGRDHRPRPIILADPPWHKPCILPDAFVFKHIGQRAIRCSIDPASAGFSPEVGGETPSSGLQALLAGALGMAPPCLGRVIGCICTNLSGITFFSTLSAKPQFVSATPTPSPVSRSAPTRAGNFHPMQNDPKERTNPAGGPGFALAEGRRDLVRPCLGPEEPVPAG